MFDLIPLDGFMPILKEMARVLKPGRKLVLVNMSKPDSRKTNFERIYEMGWAVMPCRPVLMSPYMVSETASLPSSTRNAQEQGWSCSWRKQHQLLEGDFSRYKMTIDTFVILNMTLKYIQNCEYEEAICLGELLVLELITYSFNDMGSRRKFYARWFAVKPNCPALHPRRQSASLLSHPKKESGKSYDYSCISHIPTK